MFGKNSLLSYPQRTCHVLTGGDEAIATIIPCKPLPVSEIQFHAGSLQGQVRATLLHFPFFGMLCCSSSVDIKKGKMPLKITGTKEKDLGSHPKL